MARMIHCIKLGREAEGLDFPPYPGELGKRIYEHVSKEAWAQWLKHQTMLVNENRLSLADPRARKYLAEQMERHFFGTGAIVVNDLSDGIVSHAGIALTFGLIVLAMIYALGDVSGVRCRHRRVRPEHQQRLRSRFGAQRVQQLVGAAPGARQRTGQHAPLLGHVRPRLRIGDHPVAG